MSASTSKKRTFQAPTGTRDFYPRDMLVRRYITDAWRRVSLRHGFDEIDGPTFESADLYKVKSGEGILNEMFGVFSGKAQSARTEPRPSEPRSSEPRPSGSGSDAFSSEEPLPHGRGSVDPRNPPYALRPEFTPTLARMYAARAKQLSQPTKWFTVNNFFRAERPQRGRLREFWQWNADVIGGSLPEGDCDIISVSVASLQELGLLPDDIQVRIGNRHILRKLMTHFAMNAERVDELLRVLDRRFDAEGSMRELATKAGFALDEWDRIWWAVKESYEVMPDGAHLARLFAGRIRADVLQSREILEELLSLGPPLTAAGLKEWARLDLALARGLAYYTGTVFEVIAEGERAVAGGGRYDNLIELFGGPPTPACGFGMGDAVLGNLLEDRNLIPEGREMLEALARPMPYRPDVFVVHSPNEGCEELVVPTVARLRRGEESEKYRQGQCKPWSAERYKVPPLHVRRSYKATRNVGKLLAEASACHARFAVIIESAERCTLKNLDTGEQETDVPQDRIGGRIAQAGS